MEKKVNFIILGVFVVGLFLSIIAVTIWLSDYSDNSNYKYYIVNTKDSVSGVNIKAPVKFRGVAVGEVKDIYINPKNSEEVSIVIQVKYSTPIKSDTYAIIEPQGITGLSFLQLEGGSNSSDELKTSNDKMGVIMAKASFFTQLNTTFRVIGERSEEVLISANKLIEKADKVLNDKNIKNIELLLENSAKISTSMANLANSLDRQKRDIQQIIQKAKLAEDATISAANRVGNMSDAITLAVEGTGIETMQKMSSAADSVKKIMNDMEQKLGEGVFDLKDATKELTEPTNEALNQLNILLIQTEQLIEQLKQSPSDILYKYSTQKPGPGEKNQGANR